MTRKLLTLTSVIIFCLLACSCASLRSSKQSDEKQITKAVADQKGDPVGPKQLPSCIVKEQRLTLSDGSAILLDHLPYYGTASEYFETGRHPTASHPAGRIALPRKCMLANGTILTSGWYSVIVRFKPGADEVVFLRTKGISCLQSAYQELTADIQYRVSHADADGDGTIDEKEFRRAFDPPPPRPLRDRDAHLAPYSGIDSSIRGPSVDDTCGHTIERVSAPLRVKEMQYPRERSSLELLPTNTNGTFTLEIVFGRYKGATSFSMIRN